MHQTSLAPSRFGICAIGDAIVDSLAQATDEFLAREGIEKGIMCLVEEEFAARIYGQMTDPVEASGGSAANSVAGYTNLGGKAAFMGKVADDRLGQVYRDDMAKLGVHFTTPPLKGGAGTGRCIISVTPDAQRSMTTFLGAATEFAPEDLDPQLIRDSAITYLEGYLFDPAKARQAFFDAIAMVKGANRRLALTLSDPFVVTRHRDGLRQLIEQGVDILFANEHELMELTETADVHAAVAAMQGKCPLLVTTRGPQGALVVANGAPPIIIAAEPATRLVDTTGAGDQFAGGFLYGLTHGYDLAASGRIGALAASEVISHFGPRPQQDLKALLHAAGLAQAA